MSSNNDSLQFGILTSRELGTSKLSGRQSGVSKNQYVKNKQAFAHVFSQSLHKQAQTDNKAVKKNSREAWDKQSASVTLNRRRIADKKITQRQSQGAHASLKRPAHGKHAPVGHGKKLPQDPSAKHSKTESKDTVGSGDTAQAAKLNSLKQPHKKGDRDDYVHDTDGDKKNNGNNDGSLENGTYALNGIPVDNNIPADGGQDAQLNLSGGDTSGQTQSSDAPDLERSEFAAAIPITENNGSLPQTVSSSAQVSTPIIPANGVTDAPAVAVQTQAAGQSQLQGNYYQQIQNRDSSGDGTVSPALDSTADESPQEGLNDADLKSKDAVTSGGTQKPNQTVLQTAADQGVAKPAAVTAQDTTRSLNDFKHLANHLFDKNSVPQSVNAQSAGNIGQHTGNTTGDNHQSSQQDASLLKERFFTLVQQASINQTSPSDSGSSKPTVPQHISLLEHSGDLQSDDVNLNSTPQTTLVNRTNNSPLQTLTPLLQTSSAFGHNGWSTEVGHKVMWMVHTDLQQAQLHLNPKHLGPLEIKITMNADQQVNVNFLTHSTAVKDALDQAMPRLREVFDQNGLNLSNVNVQQESHQQNRDQQHNNAHSSARSSYLAENVCEEIPAVQAVHSRGLSSGIVDYYA